MCRPAKCKTCNKTTWAGCGQHIGAVKASVPADQWCDGRHSDAEIAEARAARGGFLSRLVGR